MSDSNSVIKQRGFVLWMTGLSGSGKTTIALILEEELKGRGLKVERLDGDIVRQSLTRDLGFSKEDREKNIERVTFVAKLLSRNGVACICSFISPYREMREKIRLVMRYSGPRMIYTHPIMGFRHLFKKIKNKE